jgi:hypothetical protein
MSGNILILAAQLETSFDICQRTASTLYIQRLQLQIDFFKYSSSFISFLFLPFVHLLSGQFCNLNGIQF